MRLDLSVTGLTPEQVIDVRNLAATYGKVERAFSGPDDSPNASPLASLFQRAEPPTPVDEDVPNGSGYGGGRS